MILALQLLHSCSPSQSNSRLRDAWLRTVSRKHACSRQGSQDTLQVAHQPSGRVSPTQQVVVESRSETHMSQCWVGGIEIVNG